MYISITHFKAKRADGMFEKKKKKSGNGMAYIFFVRKEVHDET